MGVARRDIRFIANTDEDVIDADTDNQIDITTEMFQHPEDIRVDIERNNRPIVNLHIVGGESIIIHNEEVTETADDDDDDMPELLLVPEPLNLIQTIEELDSYIESHIVSYEVSGIIYSRMEELETKLRSMFDQMIEVGHLRWMENHVDEFNGCTDNISMDLYTRR